ncbi:MAG: D-alanyl-D-alanine carboxypeptidase family protein [Moraxella sp.]|nr:D-alanyl-D-alanine carboxypeptidase family protein [Moraxella sp.]
MTFSVSLLARTTSAVLLAFGLGLSAHANTGIIAPTQDNAAYILMDYDTGEVLAQKNADNALAPASLTKMMTSYIVEQRLLSGQLSEDTPIMMSENAWCRGKSTESCMYVPVGKTATAIDMLRGIIIQSGNDASKAVAEHIAGSESAFATLMNEEAKKLGMTNTYFVNATGMPAENHASSAKDLAVLARAIIRDSGQYYPIYAEKSFTYNGITQGNRNTLLLTDSTVDGLKTGHTNEAGYCLVASSNRDGMRLIAVVMGAKSMQARADQTRELLSFGFGHFENATKAPKGQSIANAPVRFGKSDKVELITEDALKVLTTKTQSAKIHTITQINPDITAPIARGQELGQLIATVDGQPVASVPLVAAEEVAQVGFITRMWRSMTSWIGGLF